MLKKILFLLKTLPYYHRASRRVCRDFCVERTSAFCRIFVLDVGACAMMPNRNHMVMHVDR